MTQTKTKSKKSLVIVESPAKAKTINKYLGSNYIVKASMGHVRDLPSKSIAVDINNSFEPTYEIIPSRKKTLADLKKAAQSSDTVYLATDLDREGEAIAWHLMESVGIDPKITRRVVFHEITEPAIAAAFDHSRDIDMSLVDAQQARRILDRLVGYNLSPLLWRKVRGRLSAGRVQSVALRLIADREREVDAFVPVEYWTIAGEFIPEGGDQGFTAKLARIDDAEPVLPDEATVKPILEDLNRAGYKIGKIKRGERKRNPSPPFITSTLQQEASRRLGYTARRTMALAQQLYEGIDIGESGTVGLITYMRTDSTNISQIAQEETKNFITERYGARFLPDTPPKYKKAVGAQEAHEAIRPTSVLRQPESLKQYLNRDQFRLYQLIWQRFVASQMAAAIYDTLSVEVHSQTGMHSYIFRASGSLVAFHGFLIVYEEARDEDQKPDEEEETTRIPANLQEGQEQRLAKLLPEQHFTQPPPRYSEASLVRALEENGIGRPSTYAPILATLQQRGYVTRDGKRLTPTDTGLLVNDLLIEHFPDILNVGFTAHMEADLDRIAAGEMPWVKVVREFYEPFSIKVSEAEEKMPSHNMGPEPIGRDCPKCGHELVIRWGRYGKFISCSSFPDCRYTEAWLEKIGVTCPKDGGDIVERKTRKGRTFYGCANYPNCDFTSWKLPLPRPCPQCGGLLVVADKQNAQCLQCEERFPLDQVVIEPADEMVDAA